MSQPSASKIVYYGYTGLIDSNSVTKIAASFNNAINLGYEEIYCTFSSLGGYVADGIFLYNHIRALPIKVTLHNIGSVASIAASIFVAAETRYCSKHSMFMIHPTSFPPSERMSASHLQSSLSSALADDDRTEQILRDATSIPKDILSDRRIKDVHISPTEALSYGLVQDIREFALPQGEQIFQL